MRIYFHELSEEPKHLEFSEKDAWVAETVNAAQESDETKNSKQGVTMDLRKSQDLVFLKGKGRLQLGLLCSRCVKHIDFAMNVDFENMFTRQESMDSNVGGTHGVAYSEPTGATGDELDLQYLERDYIELEDVLKEQIYLHLPYQPLCKEDCKGICPVCGQDRNVQPCQCHRLKNNALANALRNIKIS